MPASQLNEVMRYLRRLTTPPGADGLSDGELLRRFVAGRDETAFKVLLCRHGPMVLGVCRRLLGNDADAEDAFQAVFLILARRAASLRHHGPVGGWLHGVAHNTAIKARAMRSKRRAKESEAMARRPAATADVWPELCGVLDEELKRLPAKYREPIVLCDLEGKTVREAAQQLGWPQGSVASRLARGRALLAGRLRRLGMALSAGTLATLLAHQASAEGLPPPLAAATLHTVSGAISTRVALLEEGTVKGMLLEKLRGLATVAVLTLVAATSVVGLSGLPAAPPETQSQGSNREPARKEAAKADAAGDTLPPQALARLGTTRLRHGDQLSNICFTADGKGLLTAGQDGYVRVWDISNGKELRRLGHASDPGLRPGCRDYVFGGLRLLAMEAGNARTGGVFSADRRTAALAELDGTVSIWDIVSGKERSRVEGTQKQGGVFGLGLSAEGRQLVSLGKDETLILWDTATGQELRRFATGPASSAWKAIAFGIGGDSIDNCVFSTDGKRLATLTIDDKRNVVVQVWDVARGHAVWQVTGAVGQSPPVFSADGKRLVRLAGDHSVLVHDAATGKELRHIAPPQNDLFPTRIALASNSRLLAAQTAEDIVLIYDLEAGKIIHELGKSGTRRFDSTRMALAFSPDGKTLAQGVDTNSVRLWNLASGKARDWTDAGHGGPVTALGISSDGKRVTTVAGDGLLRVWDAATGKERRHLQVGQKGTTTLSPDGRMLAICADDGLHLQEAKGGKEIGRFRAADAPANPSVGSARFSADGRRVAWAGTSFQQRNAWTLHIWDIATGKERRHWTGETWMGNWPPDADRYLADYALSPDGSLLLTLTSQAAAPRPGVPLETTFQVHLRDVDSGGELWQVEGGEPYRAGIFSPDGRTVATATREHLAVYEVASGKQRAHFKAPAWKLALSPDGRVLAAADDGSVTLWDVCRSKQIARLNGHQARVEALMFTPDGKALVTASADSTALVWDLSRLVPPLQPAAWDAEQVSTLWNDLASADAGRAFRAIVALGAAPRQAVPWLEARLKPVAPPDSRRIARLITHLDSDAFDVRTRAAKELEKLGDLAGPALRKALAARPSPEVGRHIEGLLRGATASRALSAEELRALRAVEVLERAATAEARALLATLSKGADEARLTREARAALQRLRQ
jgi:RNA polymerase sigma factor (sigma-70 family)